MVAMVSDGSHRHKRMNEGLGNVLTGKIGENKRERRDLRY